MLNIFLNTMQKSRLTIPYSYQEIVKISNWFYSGMTSTTMFTPNQNLFNFVAI